VGTAFAVPFGYALRIDSTWEWDLPARYRHQVQRVTGRSGLDNETIFDSAGDHLRLRGSTCWTETQPPDEDDALQAGLELQEWDAPPSTASAWRVAYAPAERQPDGSVGVRWTGFVADGAALIGPDGFLRSVHIIDHHQASGRTVWHVVHVDFTGFPAAITPVSPPPACA
jgi:hypothetical protein